MLDRRSSQGDWHVPVQQEDNHFTKEAMSEYSDEYPLIRKSNEFSPSRSHFFGINGQRQRSSRRSGILSSRSLRLFAFITIGALIFLFSRAYYFRTRQVGTGGKALEWYERQKAGVFGDSIDSPWNNTGAVRTWKKPEGFRIVGMVFFGRSMFVDILDCYLRKNLVTNGGYLDEVWFMQNTGKEEDIEWLTRLVDTEPLYTRIVVGEGKNFDNIWKYPSDNDTMYIKIDDDVVYVHEEAIPRMVHTLLDHPEAHDIAANIVNSPLTNWFHFHSGAIYPYLPELQPPEPADPGTGPGAWRASELPSFPQELAPDEYDFAPQAAHDWEALKVGEPGGPPREGHRWLPLGDSAAALMKTPIMWAEYAPFGRELISWAMAAQQQYSLLRNIEDGTMNRYWFGGGDDGLWNMQYERYNLNFLAIWGRSVQEMLPGEDDEADLTANIPRKLKKPLLVDTKAIVAHFNFGPQPEVKQTDLLDRYRAYANEFVCAPFNQKAPLNMADFMKHSGSAAATDFTDAAAATTALAATTFPAATPAAVGGIQARMVAAPWVA